MQTRKEPAAAQCGELLFVYNIHHFRLSCWRFCPAAALQQKAGGIIGGADYADAGGQVVIHNGLGPLGVLLLDGGKDILVVHTAGAVLVFGVGPKVKLAGGAELIQECVKQIEEDGVAGKLCHHQMKRKVIFAWIGVPHAIR